MKRTRALLTIALPAVLLTAATLTGCSAEEPAAQQDCAPAGDASKAVELDGDFGGELELTSKTPAAATALERSVLIDGDGEPIAEGASAVANFTVFNGKTGEPIAPGASTTIVNDAEQVAPWAAQSLACSAIGDRVVTVVPVVDVLGAGGGAGYELEDTDTLIAVFDFTGLALMRAEGEAVDPPKGLPTVELGEDGDPTITIPEGQKPPTELQIATLIQGDGEEVKDGDQVRVHYRGVIWRTGEEFDASWTNGTPAEFTTDGVIPGFQKALVGQKVGSQVIAVIPAADGYGDKTSEKIAGAENDDVLVFVVDILGTTHLQ